MLLDIQKISNHNFVQTRMRTKYRFLQLSFTDDYRNFVENSITETMKNEKIGINTSEETLEAPHPNDLGLRHPISTSTNVGITEKQGDALKSKDTIDQFNHFKYLFRDDICDFYCKVLFPGEFEQFREKSLKSRTELILSLSECSRFKASGGKSGVKFFKTLDDRFLLKELNRSEARDVTTFIPKYLNYINKAHSDGSSNTLLAKILGVFDVGYKNHETGRQSGIMFILMENLTYGRCNITGSYDLKGSRRYYFLSTLYPFNDIYPPKKFKLEP